MKRRSSANLAPVFVVFTVFTAFIFTACSSHQPKTEVVDPAAQENAIFACRQNIQIKKKARFEKLPPLVKRILGENQVLKEFNHAPSKREIWGAIGKFPLAGDSGGSWRSAPGAASRIISGRIETSDAGQEKLILEIGQPSRTSSISLAGFKRELRAIDEHHVLFAAKEGPASSYALIRTYGEQLYDDESATQVSNYPIFSAELGDEACISGHLE